MRSLGFIRNILFSSIFILCNLILTSLNTEARTFKNAYVSFEMADNWKCKLEQTEWVCRADDAQESKEAVIILTAKEKGPTDTSQIYLDHLSKPIQLNSKTGANIQSKVISPPTEQIINDQKWFDGMHLNSEIVNYYTRYLATIKDQIAILVTFSAHNKFYSKHQATFLSTIKSLRVIATKDLLARPDLGPLRGSNEVLGQGVGQAIPSDLLQQEDDAAGGANGKKGLLQNEYVWGAALLLLLILIYVGIKVYQKRNN